MKRLIFILLSAVCLFSLSACGGNDHLSVSTISPSEAKADISLSSSEVPDETQAASTAGASTSAAPTEQTETSDPQKSSSIVVESSNAVSDKEKESILSSLSSQLDGMLDDSQDLDDVDKTDLDTSDN